MKRFVGTVIMLSIILGGDAMALTIYDGKPPVSLNLWTGPYIILGGGRASMNNAEYIQKFNTSEYDRARRDGRLIPFLNDISMVTGWTSTDLTGTVDSTNRITHTGLNNNQVWFGFGKHADFHHAVSSSWESLAHIGFWNGRVIVPREFSIPVTINLEAAQERVKRYGGDWNWFMRVIDGMFDNAGIASINPYDTISNHYGCATWYAWTMGSITPDIPEVVTKDNFHLLKRGVNYVQSIEWCEGDGLFAGCAIIGGNKIAISMTSPLSVRWDRILLHEIGHSQGLADNYSNVDNIMYKSASTNGRSFTKEQCWAIQKSKTY